MTVPDLSHLDTLDEVALSARYRAIIVQIESAPKKEDDDSVPISVLHELAYIARALRRKNAGPPKARSSAGGKKSPMPSLTTLLTDL